MGLKVVVTPAGSFDLADVQGTEITAKPIFYGNGRDVCNVAAIKVMDDDKVVHLCVLRLCGASLRLSLADRTQPCLSQYEKKKTKKGDTKNDGRGTAQEAAARRQS